MTTSTKKAPSSAVSARGLSVAVLAARFNQSVVDPMIESSLQTLEGLGLSRTDVRIHCAPGAFELPLLAKAVIAAESPDCVIALGAVIRGETPHFDFVAGEAARGLQSVALETGVPISFGIITANNMEQAMARTRAPLDRGAEASRAAVEMAGILKQLCGSRVSRNQ